MEDPATMPPKPDNEMAWPFWIIATIVLPSIAGGFYFTGGNGPVVTVFLGVVSFVLHLVVSMKINNVNGCAVIGGWVLMVASFFVGCLVNFPKI
ncbi:MAG: hypothetical protein U1F81_14890 [Verrucomicrobiaceae bacterium]